MNLFSLWVFFLIFYFNAPSPPALSLAFFCPSYNLSLFFFLPTLTLPLILLSDSLQLSLSLSSAAWIIDEAPLPTHQAEGGSD